MQALATRRWDQSGTPCLVLLCPLSSSLLSLSSTQKCQHTNQSADQSNRIVLYRVLPLKHTGKHFH